MLIAAVNVIVVKMVWNNIVRMEWLAPTTGRKKMEVEIPTVDTANRL